MTPPILAAADAITLDFYKVVTVGGLTFHLNTILASVVAAGIVAGLGLYVGRRATAGVPGKGQLLWETVIGTIETQVERSIGPRGRRVVPFAFALFAFTLIASWLELLPGGPHPKALPPPTGDINLTAALAVLVMVAVHATSIRTRGLRGYLRHYLQPRWWLLPLNLVEELVKPLSLALRLFGNVFAGMIMVVLIGELFPPYVAPLPLLVWKAFAVFVALLQALIFALLTMLYFETALKPDEETPRSRRRPGRLEAPPKRSQPVEPPLPNPGPRRPLTPQEVS